MIAPHARRGYTVVEMVMVVVIVALLAALAYMPASASDAAQSDAAGRQFAGMVEYAQSLAVARPDQTYLIKIDQAANRFWLANQSAPDTPLTHPVKKTPYLVQLGAASTSGLKSVQISGIAFGGDNVIQFDSTGAMDQATPAQIELTIGGRKSTISASPTTGTVDVYALDLATANVAVNAGN